MEVPVNRLPVHSGATVADSSPPFPIKPIRRPRSVIEVVKDGRLLGLVGTLVRRRRVVKRSLGVPGKCLGEYRHAIATAGKAGPGRACPSDGDRTGGLTGQRTFRIVSPGIRFMGGE